MNKLRNNFYVCEECLTNEVITKYYVQITNNDTDHRHVCHLCKKKTKNVVEVLSKKEWNKRMQEEKEYYEACGDADKYNFVFYD